VESEQKKKLSLPEKIIIIIILILAIYGVFSLSKEGGRSLSSLYYTIRTKLLYNKIIKVSDFTLINEDSESTRLFNNEKAYTVIFIGALGCNACIKELLSFPNYKEEFDSFQKNASLFIAVTDNKEAIKRFKESNNFNFPIYTINWKDVC